MNDLYQSAAHGEHVADHLGVLEGRSWRHGTPKLAPLQRDLPAPVFQRTARQFPPGPFYRTRHGCLPGRRMDVFVVPAGTSTLSGQKSG